MKIKLNTLISFDDLAGTLKKDFVSFSDERHYVIDINLFIPIFTYKYGIPRNFNFLIEKRKTCYGVESENEFVLTCDSYGFRYSFPLHKP